MPTLGAVDTSCRIVETCTPTGCSIPNPVVCTEDGSCAAAKCELKMVFLPDPPTKQISPTAAPSAN